jgi:hypothetical protein
MLTSSAAEWASQAEEKLTADQFSGSMFLCLTRRLLAIGTFALKHVQGVATGAALGAITEMPTSQTL